MKIRLRPTPCGNILATVLLGPKDGALQNAGELRLRIGEYQLIAAALMSGAKQTAGQLSIEIEGEKEALAEWTRSESVG